MTRHVYFSIATLILISCAGSEVKKLSQNTYPEKPAGCPIDVFENGKKPSKKFEELCQIDAHSGQAVMSGRDLEALLPDMKADACKCGADAIIITKSKEGELGVVGFGSSAGKASAIAVKYK